jgi:CheY-like chemotaxis protein
MASLDGLRVLVVEDELLVAMVVENILGHAGCLVVGPFRQVRKAIEAARMEAIDIALLDVNLAGERVFPVAEVLAQRGVPFVFMTGYGPGVLPAQYADRPMVGKPFKAPDLIDRLSNALCAHPAQGAVC